VVQAMAKDGHASKARRVDEGKDEPRLTVIGAGLAAAPRRPELGALQALLRHVPFPYHPRQPRPAPARRKRGGRALARGN